MRILRWVYRISAVLGLLVILSVLAAPAIIRAYINRTMPGVEVRGDATVLWLQAAVIVEDVGVDRPNTWGTLNHVFVDSDKNVRVKGGELNVTLVPGESSGEGSGISLSGQDLDVTVSRNGVVAITKGLTFDHETVCVKEAEVEYEKVQATVLDGCVKRDKTFATARKVSLPVTTSFQIPGLGTEFEAEAHWVDINLASKTMEAREVTLTEKGEERGVIILRPENSLTAIAAKLTDTEVTAKIEVTEIRHPWVSKDGGYINGVDVRVPLSIRSGSGEVEVNLGKTRVTVDPFTKAIRGEGGCAAWVDALPSPSAALLDAREGLTGDLSFDVKTKPVTFKLNSTCKFQCSKSPIKELKERTFDYRVYVSKGGDMERVPRTTGRGSPSWTSLQDLPPHVGKAFILLEDPGFEKHRGVLPLALENSFKLNLEHGEFMRGGSTITMQLAKNLWLTRSKTVTRKAEEALLTYALESCFSKADILEMYLNVVEFGPGVYGISEGAKYRFHKSPGELSPEEAFYLASILPSPIKALPPKQGGLDKARKIMKMLSKSGFISEYMLDEGPAPATDDWNLNL